MTVDPIAQLRADWAGVDIMLVDQAMRGRIAPGARIADAGCGAGRNLAPFLRAGYPVWGCDTDSDAVAACQALATAHGGDPDRFRCEAIEATTLPAGAFDLVLCNAVLHFAADGDHFLAMARALAGLLAPGGLLVTRLATRDVWPAGVDAGAFGHLPSIADLEDATTDHGLILADPIKTTVTHARRCMTTWCALRP